MAKQSNSTKKPGAKKLPEKKPLIDPRYKNPISTGIIILVLIIFFIINNTRKEPERGPYPPYYQKQMVE
ncbi:MAG: hypothetical protein HUU54_06930 [Ignavibacteriaceae bacterium]|nr:hypothetical protein [Ignavibacteriaceae bacterium]